ncbi:MAG TPA: carboxymuconolactone decarboxylase family protein [Thermoanaerobaculia bacterium]|nr:carboxymuconolactone decarboxylase family protein [Thermoanaerobaculia bacterium]
MIRIAPCDSETPPSGRVRELFDDVAARHGRVPNLHRTLAHSPAALDGYLALDAALDRGRLERTLRERIALAVAEINLSSYCLSAHAATSGLSGAEIRAARLATAEDPKADALLKLACQLVLGRGDVSDGALASARAAGVGPAEIAEVVANVAANVLANYITLIAETEVDYELVIPGDELAPLALA